MANATVVFNEEKRPTMPPRELIFLRHSSHAAANNTAHWMSAAPHHVFALAGEYDTQTIHFSTSHPPLPFSLQILKHTRYAAAIRAFRRRTTD